MDSQRSDRGEEEACKSPCKSPASAEQGHILLLTVFELPKGLSKWVRQWCSGHRFYQLSWNYTDQLAHVHKSPELKLNLVQE